MEPTFSANVRVTPTHSPPAGVVQSNAPFIRPTQPESSAQPNSQTTSVITSLSMLPGTGFSATQHQPASKAKTSVSTATTLLPGTGFSASQHQPASKVQTKKPTSTSQLPGTGSSALQRQPTSKVQ